MSAKIIPVAAFDLVVFGGTGDLTLRKLLPALYHRFRDGQLPDECRIIARRARPTRRRRLPRAARRGAARARRRGGLTTRR